MSKILQNCDLFGVDIGLIYNNNRKFTSKIGGIVSIALMCVMFSLAVQLILQITNRENPNIIFQQMQVENPSKYVLNKQKFQFVIQFINDRVPFVDDEVFTIEGTFNVKSVTTSPNGAQTVNFNTIKLIIDRCSMDDFQQEETLDYFSVIKNGYCIKNQDDLYLVGQWEKSLYSYLDIKLKECVGPNCKDPSIRQKIIKSGQIQIYFTDHIIDQKNFSKPFKAIGKTLFYNIFYDYVKLVSFIFQTKHVEDDIGLITYEEKKSKELFFTRDREVLISKTNESVFVITIFLEKDKEEKFLRSYLKLPTMVSLLGGIFNVLYLVGCIISKPYNKLKLIKSLFDDIFVIKKQKNEGNSYTEEIQVLESTQKEEINKQRKESNQKSEALSNKISYFVSSQLQCFKCYSNEILEVISTGQKQINKYLSVDHIINKLVELDKITNIILHAQDNDKISNLITLIDDQQASSLNVKSKNSKQSFFLHEKVGFIQSKDLIQSKLKKLTLKSSKGSMLKQSDQMQVLSPNGSPKFQVNLLSQSQNLKQFDQNFTERSLNLESEIANENQNLKSNYFMRNEPNFLKKISFQNQQELISFSPLSNHQKYENIPSEQIMTPKQLNLN